MEALKTVASNTIALDESGTVIDSLTNLPFDINSYGMMKYGNRDVTKRFADELVPPVLAARPELLEDERPPKFVASFSVVPPVPFHISRYVLSTINAERSERDLEPATILRVDKSRTQNSNYAILSAKERVEEWDSIDFFFTRGELERPTRDTQIVILDDVRITGAFTRKLMSVFTGHSPERMMLGFVAIFNEQQALERPDIEDRLNGTNGKTVADILPLIEQDNFDLNIRTLKMILSTDPEILIPFLERCPAELVEKMLRDTVDSGTQFLEYHRTGSKCMDLVLRSGA